MARISELRASNFRSLRDVTIEFAQQTVLVGANNVGKTSVLEALDRAFAVGRRAPGYTESDVSEGTDTHDGFELRITLQPTDGDEFSADEKRLFGYHVDMARTTERVLIQVVGRVEPEDGVFRSRLRFIKDDLADDGPVTTAERSAIGFVLLHALRDARREFYERSGLWSRIGSLQEVDDTTAAEISAKGRQLGDEVVSALLGAGVRASIVDRVAGLLSDVLYAGQPGSDVQFSLTPLDVAEALREIELRIMTPGHAEVRRVTDHSTGTQSVAMFGLFSAYIEAVGDAITAMGIEEPEAHLHPHATRAMVRAIPSLNTQTILTTHSTAVTDAADPRGIVLLRRRGGNTIVGSIAHANLSDAEVGQLRLRLAEAGSDFLFARTVLLAEGPSERLALPIFARSLGYDWDILGISLVPVAGNDFDLFLRVLGPGALDIAHLVACDEDAARKLMRKLRDLGRLPPGSDPDDTAASRAPMATAGFHYWTAGNFEAVLMDAGFAPLYVAAFEALYGANYLRNFARGQPTPPPALDEPAFLGEVLQRGRVSKPRLAQHAAELSITEGIAPPAEVVDLLEQAAASANREALLVATAAPTGP